VSIVAEVHRVGVWHVRRGDRQVHRLLFVVAAPPLIAFVLKGVSTPAQWNDWGHNPAADLLGKPLLPLQIGWHTTILDLGPWGAVYTNGWDRHVIATGPAAKATKQSINSQRIDPPRTKKRGKTYWQLLRPRFRRRRKLIQKET
jgi:hypothetical protein